MLAPQTIGQHPPSLGLTRALAMLNHAFRWTPSVGDECHVTQYVLLLANNWCREELLHGLGCPTLSCICVEDVDAVPESAHHTSRVKSQTAGLNKDRARA